MMPPIYITNVDGTAHVWDESSGVVNVVLCGVATVRETGLYSTIARTCPDCLLEYKTRLLRSDP